MFMIDDEAHAKVCGRGVETVSLDPMGSRTESCSLYQLANLRPEI